MKAKERILGIEGGGTKTEWLFSPGGGAALTRGKLGGANLRLIDDEALGRLLRVLPEADRVGIFLAGCLTREDRQRLEACARRVWPGAVLVAGNDRQSGFAAAFPEGEGIAVIAGTGSAITGRAQDLRGQWREERAAGWGHLLGDKGSGYDLAVQALRSVLWNFDLHGRIEPTGRAILAALGLNRLADLVTWAASADKMAVARLAPVVFEGAREGREEMAAIVESGAAALAEGTDAVARRLGFDAPEVRLQGGLFEHHPLYTERFRRRLAALRPRAHVEPCSVSGAMGALRLAGGEPPVAVSKPGATGLAEADLDELASALTEQSNPRSEGLDQMSTPRMVDLFIAEEERVSEALRHGRDALIAAIELAADALRHGGRLFYVGAGTSGRLGVLDASEIPPTFGENPERVQAIMAGGVEALHRAVEGAEDEPEAGALAVLERGVRRGDVLLGITASGRTPFVIGALEAARKQGARPMLLTCNPARRREVRWEVEIDLASGPELLTGSTRLKAGTATKCALNILSTAVMVQLGRVRGNQMAGVLVSNAKLRDRAIRLVAALRGWNRAEAEACLERHGWDVRRCLA